MARVAIALGSNLGDRSGNISFAVDQLSPLLQPLYLSPVIETEPVGSFGQPRFLNACLTGEWAGSAQALLDLLLEIERRAGRARPHPHAARTLDLDLILFSSAVIDEPGLVVPHPRFRERGFVLEPLSAVARDMVDPVTGQTVGELYQAWAERQR
jgi:2-amino-4-hydroxy-6-hydroxymethyldihydropteridine diphosphokinase